MTVIQNLTVSGQGVWQWEPQNSRPLFWNFPNILIVEMGKLGPREEKKLGSLSNPTAVGLESGLPGLHDP